jgi:hypothetical protein
MSYTIIEHKNQYSLIIKSNIELIINGKIYFIDPILEELDTYYKNKYMLECIKIYTNNYINNNFINISTIYNNIEFKLDNNTKRTILIKCYIDSKLNDFFPGIKYYTANNNFIIIFHDIKLKSSYNIGLHLEKAKYNKINCIGYENYLKLPCINDAIEKININSLLY